MRLLLLIGLSVGLSVCAHAQHDHAHSASPPDAPAGSPDGPTPSSLSPSDVDGLLAGLGMGLARPAERHSYPGPLHVLEHADDLGLTRSQRSLAETLRADVLARAQDIGARIVGMERHLDALFASGRASDATVDRLTGHIAQAQGALRAIHLRAHVAMREALTPDQIRTYDRLRGHTR